MNTLVPLPTLPIYLSRREKVEGFLTAFFGGCRSCTACALGTKCANVDGVVERDPHVFSNLNYSRIMVVGQNPGANEVIQREPFVGQAGAMFDFEIEANGLSRLDFYLTNTVKCFSAGNEKPSPVHERACSYVLMAELAVLRPALVVTLGETAFRWFVPAGRYRESLGKVMSSRSDLPYGPYPVFPVFHPSPRNLEDLDRLASFKKQIRRLAQLVRAVKDHASST